jgi:hypothetical protein
VKREERRGEERRGESGEWGVKSEERRKRRGKSGE